MVTAIILAAGRGERMGLSLDKAFLSLGSKPVVAYSLSAFEMCQDVDSIVLVVRREKIEAAREMCKLFRITKLVSIVTGGASRQSSVRAGLDAMPLETTVVSIHDSARPLVTPALISATVQAAKKHGSGVAAHRVVDTIKLVEKGSVVSSTVDRSHLWAVETPQTFKVDLIRRAYDEVDAKKSTVTDDAGAVETAGGQVHLVEWLKPNMKITYADDLVLVGSILGK